MAKGTRYYCVRTVDIDGRLYKGGQVYEFSFTPKADRYFKPVRTRKVKRSGNKRSGHKKEESD
jgi:hypothetical protein